MALIAAAARARDFKSVQASFPVMSTNTSAVRVIMLRSPFLFESVVRNRTLGEPRRAGCDARHKMPQGGLTRVIEWLAGVSRRIAAPASGLAARR
jgi:hypothetical protein